MSLPLFAISRLFIAQGPFATNVAYDVRNLLRAQRENIRRDLIAYGLNDRVEPALS
jgi:hypothetical protein